MKKFTLEIELGNEAMLTASDVAEQLFYLCSKLKIHGFEAPSAIMDTNGNKVGEWDLTDFS